MSDCEHTLAYDQANDTAVCIRCGRRWFPIPFDEDTCSITTDWPLPEWVSVPGEQT